MASGDYYDTLSAQRAKRLADLTAESGWLSVAGLHWVDELVMTVGSAGDRDIVLAAGPARWGTLTVSAGRVHFAAEAGSETHIGGAPSAGGEIFGPDLPEGAVDVTSGAVSFGVIERGGRLAIRVRDPAASNRQTFDRIDYFGVDASWNVTAQWQQLDEPMTVSVDNVIGLTVDLTVNHVARFVHEGREITLIPTYGTAERPMFVFRDATSGASSYGSGRFVFGEVKGDRVRLDFNTAICPPCAFTAFATCALPPKANRLDLAIEAGEQKPVWKASAEGASALHGASGH